MDELREAVAELEEAARRGSSETGVMVDPAHLDLVLSALDRCSGPDGPSGLASTQLSRQSDPASAAEAWGWHASRDAENYQIGPEATREAVIGAATSEFGGEPFWICEARATDVVLLMPKAQQIIEDSLERWADDGMFGDCGDFDLNGKPDEHRMAFRELDAALQGWFANWRHIFPRPWAFAATRNEQYIDPAQAERDASQCRRRGRRVAFRPEADRIPTYSRGER